MLFTPNAIGVDENNFSPSIAGPVTVTALYPIKEVPGVKDSKLLSPKRRLELYGKIQRRSVYVVVPASIAAIREAGVYEARNWAMAAAVQALHYTLKPKRVVDRVIVDGYWSDMWLEKFQAVTGLPWFKGSDSTDYAVAAASVIGKVQTDILFAGAATMWPGYGDAFNHGAVSEEHAEALRTHGRSPWHRPLNYGKRRWAKLLNGEG